MRSVVFLKINKFSILVYLWADINEAMATHQSSGM